MAKIAFVFAGQGAQYSGMGQDLYGNSLAAAKVFDQAEQLRPGTKAQCFEGSQETLSQTCNTQPCLFCVDLAAAYSLQSWGVNPVALAGFSLGEIAALTYGQTFDFTAGFTLICRRAALMQQVGQQQASAMVAVMKLPPATLTTLCGEFAQTYPVNYNWAGQTVVALAQENLSAFCQQVKALGGRAVTLPVSGGFHSPFMDAAAVGLAQALANQALPQPNLPVYANLTGAPYDQAVRETIIGQVNHPVYWQRSIEAMAAAGIDTFIEVGAGQVLTGLIHKILPQAAVCHVEDMTGLEAAVKRYGDGRTVRRQPC